MTRQHPLAEPKYYSYVDFKGKNGIAGLNQLRLYADWQRIFAAACAPQLSVIIRLFKLRSKMNRDED